MQTAAATFFASVQLSHLFEIARCKPEINLHDSVKLLKLHRLVMRLAVFEHLFYRTVIGLA
nr:hypothetical protein [Pseudomonadota bacterium]